MACCVSEKAPEINAWEAMIAAERHQRPAGGEQKERLRGRGRIFQEQRALSEVVQQQRG